MTEFVFTSNDGSEWTEEEKQLCIKRYEATQKSYRQGFEDAQWKVVGQNLFIKVGEDE